MRRVLDWLKVLFEDYKLARRGSLILLVWGVVPLSVVAFWIHLKDIGEHQATVIVAILGLAAVVYGFYSANRGQDK